jgi:hypothetical protein
VSPLGKEEMPQNLPNLIVSPTKNRQFYTMSAFEERGKSSVGKIINIIGCGCFALILAGALVFGGIFFFVGKALKGKDPYRESIAAVESNEEAIAALGEPVAPGFLPSGNFNYNNGEGEVDLSIPVSGPNGKGTIRVKGRKPVGSQVWNYETWQLEVFDRPDPILLSK